MLKFWAEKHLKNDLYWLSGSSAREVLRFHNISEIIKDKDILDIGIGQGQLVEFLSQHNRVVCVDITEEALRKVNGSVSCFLTTQLRDVPRVDIAICHLVLQHCTNDEFVRIINDVQLKHNGFLSIQIAFEGDRDYSEYDMLYLRSNEFCKHLIACTNKRIVQESVNVSHWTGKWHLEKDIPIGWSIFRLAL